MAAVFAAFQISIADLLNSQSAPITRNNLQTLGVPA
jgi:hypothetical protein